MTKWVRRSSLTVPANARRFVEKAHLREADAITLDLEDGVPLSEKEEARQHIKEFIPLVTRGGAEVLVRINKNPVILTLDLEASIHRGLNGIVLPKTESAEEVQALEVQVEKLERLRGLKPGYIKFSITIESPRGLLEVREICLASARIDSMSIGPEDYCLEIGVEPSLDGLELIYPLSQIVTVCKDTGIMPRGLLGSIANFQDLDNFRRVAIRARQLGCEGAACIHPDQVKILNQVFSPSPENVAYARRVVDVFQQGVEKGQGTVGLQGKMVDIPVYKRAKLIVERAEAIAEVEERKTLALTRLSPGYPGCLDL